MAVSSLAALFATGPIAATRRLGVVMQPAPDDPHEIEGVLNPAIVRGRDNELYLFARVVAEGNYSRIRLARVAFERGRPIGVERLRHVLEPSAPYEVRPEGGGCEDPRVTYLPLLDRYLMTYTAYGPAGARVALAISDDLFTWDRLGLVSFGVQDGVDFDGFDNKDAFFFPKPVLAPDGTWSFAFMHRPMTGAGCDGTSAQLSALPASMWLSYVPVDAALGDIQQLCRPGQHRLVLTPQYGWEAVKVGGGAPPVLTDEGWLLVYHGIENIATSATPRLRYAAGVCLLDRLDPTRVLWRSRHPVLAPETEDELRGVVNNVVFPTGIDQIDGTMVDVYYGMADARIGVARLHLLPGIQTMDRPAA